MTEFRIDVLVDPTKSTRGIDSVDKSLGSAERSAADLEQALKRAFAQRDTALNSSLGAINTSLGRLESLATDAREATEGIGRGVQDPFLAQIASIQQQTEQLAIRNKAEGDAARLLQIEADLRRQNRNLTAEESKQLGEALRQQSALNAQVKSQQALEQSVQAIKSRTRAAEINALNVSQARRQALLEQNRLMGQGITLSQQQVGVLEREFQREQQITRELTRQTGQAQKLTAETQNFGGAVGRIAAALSAVLTVRGFTQLSDTLTNTQNRIRLVTDSQEELIATQEELLDIANRTRSAFDGTATVFNRLAISADELGRTNRELLNFTESLNQAIILSGASAEEARNGIIQLSQGLASGALRGDELRSVLEQLPAVADVIADGLGVTRGELRKLGQEGKITADIVLDAFKEARAELNERFATTIPTIGQSLAVLGNQALDLVGDFNSTTGAADALSQSILFLGDNLAATGAGIAAVGVGLAAIKIQAAAAAGSFAGFLTTAAPLAAIGLGVGVVAAEIKEALDNIAAAEKAFQFREAQRTLSDFALIGLEIQTTRKELERVQQTFEAGGRSSQVAADRIEELRTRLEELNQSSKDQVQAAAEAEAARNRANSSVVEVLENLREEARLLTLVADERQVQAEILTTTQALAKQGVDIRQANNAALQEEIESMIRANTVAARQAEILEGIRGPAREYQTVLSDLNALLERGAITQDEFNKAVEGFKSPTGGGNPFEAQLQAIREQNEELAIQARNFGLQREALLIELDLRRQGVELTRSQQDQLADSLLAQTKLTEELERQAEAEREQAKAVAQRERDAERAEKRVEALRRQVDVTGQLAEQEKALLELREQDATLIPQIDKALEDLRLRQLDASTDLADGFSRAFLRMKQEAEDLASVGETVANVFADKATDAIVEFTKTGELNFKEFASSVLDELTRILARLLVVQALSSIFGPAAGPAAGAATGALNLGRQRGGTVQPGQKPYPVGENGVELFVPNQTGTIVPNPKDAAPAAKPEVKVSVVTVLDPALVAESIAAGDADEAIIQRVGANRDRFNQAVQ